MLMKLLLTVDWTRQQQVNILSMRQKITGRTAANSCALNTKGAVPWKYLSNFRRFLDLPLTDCEIELDLAWSHDQKIEQYQKF